MLINKINISNYGKLRDFIVEFNPSNYNNSQMNISVIVGENGTGKTTLLKFISEAFTNNRFNKIEYLIDYSINNKRTMINNYRPRDYLRPNKVIVSSYSLFEQFRTNIDKSRNEDNTNYSETTEYVYAGPKKRNNLTSMSSVFIPIIKSFMLPNIKKSFATYELLKEIGYNNYPLIQLKRISLKKSLERRPPYINENSQFADDTLYNIAEKLDNFNYEYTNRVRTSFGSQRKKLIELTNLNYYPGGFEHWLMDVKRLDKLNINTIEDLWFPVGNDYIPMSKFSSGELSMFFRFFMLIDSIEDDSIVLIDEPETHLHPSWIQKYIKMLVGIFGQFKCHFIIATHSPMIVSDIDSNCIIGLRQNEGIIEQYKVQEQTLGVNYKDILYEVFKLDRSYGEYTSNLKEKIINLLESGNIDSAKELYNKLGDSELKFDLFVKFKEYME